MRQRCSAAAAIRRASAYGLEKAAAKMHITAGPVDNTNFDERRSQRKHDNTRESMTGRLGPCETSTFRVRDVKEGRTPSPLQRDADSESCAPSASGLGTVENGKSSFVARVNTVGLAGGMNS